MGWHDSSFVIGNDVISNDASKALKLTGPISQYAKKFSQGGNLAGYQCNVLRRASYSSRLMTGIALALLAPLARGLSLEIGGLNFIGNAGLGKTTILRVAGSFYGGGSVPYFMPWLMTDNAPETLGLAFCDLPLLLDELDALPTEGDRASAFPRPREVEEPSCSHGRFDTGRFSRHVRQHFRASASRFHARGRLQPDGSASGSLR